MALDTISAVALSPDEIRIETAVYISNLCKRFRKAEPVLQNYCMSVKKGEIYCLLGSSGCGKTTLLSCVVGLSSWDTGTLLVFGKSPKAYKNAKHEIPLGYMPQDLALYKHLSIEEIVHFYGRVCHMKKAEITERLTFLMKLLDLPTDFRQVGSLSGGEQRRTSLILALIHHPTLVVLDEPTAGLDPLVRKGVWDYLNNLAKAHGTTFIITTHYIEEARRANTIGIMRHGRLLVEDNPVKLLQTYNSTDLEQVAVQLCRKDEHTTKRLGLGNQENVELGLPRKYSGWSWNNKSHSYDVALKHCNVPVASAPENVHSQKIAGQKETIKSQIAKHYNRVYGLAVVILMACIRNPVYLGFLLIMPTIQGGVTLLTIGSPPRDLTLGIINNELNSSSLGCDFLAGNGSHCDVSVLSCLFLSHLQTGDLVKLKYLSNETDALDSVHRGKLWGYLVFPSNFSENTLLRAMTQRLALVEAIEGSQIHIHLDYSHYVHVLLILKHIIASYVDFAVELEASCDSEGGSLGGLPLHYRTPVHGSFDNDFSSYVIPGIMLTCIYGAASGMTGINLITDRHTGNLKRIRVAGVKIIDVALANIFSQSLITITQIMLWFAVVHFLFGANIFNSFGYWILFTVLTGFSGNILGIFLGFFFRDEVEILLGAMCLFTIFIFFGCVFFPIENMPYFWQHVAHFLPTFMPIKSLRAVALRGIGITNILVWQGLASLAGWTLIFLFAIPFAYKLSK